MISTCLKLPGEATKAIVEMRKCVFHIHVHTNKNKTKTHIRLVNTLPVWFLSKAVTIPKQRSRGAHKAVMPLFGLLSDRPQHTQDAQLATDIYNIWPQYAPFRSTATRSHARCDTLAAARPLIIWFTALDVACQFPWQCLAPQLLRSVVA